MNDLLGKLVSDVLHSFDWLSLSESRRKFFCEGGGAASRIGTFLVLWGVGDGISCLLPWIPADQSAAVLQLIM